MRKIRWYYWVIGLLLLVAVALGAFTVWASASAAPMPEALEALVSDSQVQVETSPWLVFTPLAEPPSTGIVFYPGGRVDPRAYAPAAKDLAEQGYLVVIPPMPFNLAVFAPDRAADVIAAFPEINCWVVGGHSLGGVMAAQVADKLGEQVSGLLFWASYPADSLDLSQSDLQVLTVSASEDGLTTPDEVQASLTRLPPSTQWFEVEGGNHAGFGWYGNQSGDGIPSITRPEQQEQIVQATLKWLQEASVCKP